jgi:hypothetical protein
MATGISPPPAAPSPRGAGGGAGARRLARAVVDALAIPFFAVAGFLGIPLFVVVGAVVFGAIGVLLFGVVGAAGAALLTWPALVALAIAAGVVRLVHARRNEEEIRRTRR